MTTITFLGEWAVRSAALITCGELLVWLLRVKDASIRLAVRTALLAGSLAIPLLTMTFPRVPVAVVPAVVGNVDAPMVGRVPALVPLSHAAATPAHFDWSRVALAVYVCVAFLLLLRLSIGLILSLRLLRASRETGRMAEGVAILESDAVRAPVTLGVVRAKIVLPRDWREWDRAKLEAILAHERSHIRRGDPAVQVVSAIHRAVLWHSPLSWVLHRVIVRTAEEASDDAAVAVAPDRTFYAEVLLEFMRRRVRRAAWMGVPMARYGRADRRIHRILYGVGLSRGITRWSATAIAAVVLPLAYMAATVHASQAASQAPAPPPPAPEAPSPTPAPRAAATPKPPTTPRPTAVAPRRPSEPDLNGLGTVTATTLMVRSKIDGELKSLGFEEGKPVETGQLLATVYAQDTDALLERAQRELANDRKLLAASPGSNSAPRGQVENQLKVDEREVERLEQVLSYGQIHAPFAGVAGLRKVDPGNLVHTGDLIVVITQLQPIGVLFSVPEDNLPEVLALLRQGPPPTVEAWNRDMTVKLATGKLVAVDNEIDKSSGTATLKATFDNKDGALFPGQFVLTQILVDGH